MSSNNTRAVYIAVALARPHSQSLESQYIPRRTVLPSFSSLKYCYRMQSVKQNALKVIEQLPDESSFEDIMEKLLFLQKVEEGLEDIRQDRVTTHDEVKKRLARWLK